MMLYKYECEKCSSFCYIGSEVWEFCPICEETPEDRKLKERAEQAERERDKLREALKECMKHLQLPTEDPWMSEVDAAYQKARRALGGE
jgi:uncharacterized Zn finger protein (UPF0148 family)